VSLSVYSWALIEVATLYTVDSGVFIFSWTEDACTSTVLPLTGPCVAFQGSDGVSQLKT